MRGLDKNAIAVAVGQFCRTDDCEIVTGIENASTLRTCVQPGAFFALQSLGFRHEAVVAAAITLGANPKSAIPAEIGRHASVPMHAVPRLLHSANRSEKTLVEAHVQPTFKQTRPKRQASLGCTPRAPPSKSCSTVCRGASKASVDGASLSLMSSGPAAAPRGPAAFSNAACLRTASPRALRWMTVAAAAALSSVAWRTQSFASSTAAGGAVASPRLAASSSAALAPLKHRGKFWTKSTNDGN